MALQIKDRRAVSGKQPAKVEVGANEGSTDRIASPKGSRSERQGHVFCGAMTWFHRPDETPKMPTRSVRCRRRAWIALWNETRFTVGDSACLLGEGSSTPAPFAIPPPRPPTPFRHRPAPIAGSRRRGNLWYHIRR
jgi:hypothetical protein